MKYVVILAFISIIGSLVAALVIMMRGGRTDAASDPGGEDSRAPRGNMARALAFRVGFSILLFLVVLFSYWMGWIQPTGIAPGQ